MSFAECPASILLATLLASASARQAPDDDPAVVRLKLLKEMDSRIATAAARAHLEARLLLDSVMPLPFLGVVPEPGAHGLTVTQVYRESGAEAAGIRVGDVILEFAGRRMDTKPVLYREIRRHHPGETIEVKVARDAKELTLRATLGMRWEEDEEDEEQFGDLVPAPFVARGLPATLDFARDLAGGAPSSLDFVLGGQGLEPRWAVARSGGAAVLRQEVPDKTGIRFPIALVAGVDADDVVAKTRFRLAGGAQDRTAGIVLRYQDSANYLVARANAVEGDVRIFRTVNGLRRTLPGAAADARIDDDAWHTLEFHAVGPKVTAVVDGKTTVTSYDTYFLHGRVGLWMKSDSITEFDAVSFTAPPR